MKIKVKGMLMAFGLVMVVLVLTGCGSYVRNSEQSDLSEQDSGQSAAYGHELGHELELDQSGNTGQNPSGITIYTSFHAMYDFTRTIAGDALEVSVLLPPGASAHHWEPSAQDMVRLSQASAFIYHGSGMEHFTDTLKASLDGQLLFIEASANVEPSLGRADPHLWLNPVYAGIIKETITEALIHIDPYNEAVYRENFYHATQRLDELESLFREASENFVRRDIVVSHGAFGHLSYAFGLNQVPIEGLQVRIDPSPARMVDIISFVRDNGVTTIFYDKDPSLALAVANNTGARVVMLDTFEGISNDDYFTVMLRNLEVLIDALS